MNKILSSTKNRLMLSLSYQKFTSLPNSPPTLDMDPGVWSRLPPEILEHILSFLPLKTVMLLRSTCKLFKSLIYSPYFVSKHSSTPSPFSSFILLSHAQCHNHFPLYDSVAGAWRDPAILHSLFVPSFEPFNLLSSSNGLFCISLPSSSSLVVSNLLSRSSRIIEFPSYPFAFEIVTLVSTPVGYKIFMLCSEFPSNYAFVYDSSTYSWTRFNCSEPILCGNNYQPCVCYNDSLYFTTEEPFSIVCFNLESGKWYRPRIELPGELMFGKLVTGGERKVYLVGGEGRNGISRSVKVWELNEGGMNFVEIERMPALMCRKFMAVCYHNYGHVYCFWHEGMICICCYTWPDILYYEVAMRRWHWLPRCPSLPYKWSCGFRWFSFVPNLYALV